MKAGATSENHIPAIDGLRAVAVAAVLIFHADVGIAAGGFLGVSLFFTLSGYLITSLLLREHEVSGTISIRGFYGRRWRRLVPSAWLCMALVLAATPLWSVPQIRALPGDALAALGNVANWRAAFADLSYQDIFIGRPSPLAHFWSLAIEEQFYAVMPLIALVALRKGRRALSTVAIILIAASVASTLLTSDRDLIYNGTHTRAAELLIGVLLALHAPVLRRVVREFIGWVAFAGFIVVVAVSSIGDDWLYRGGLAAFALISAALVLAAIGPERSGFTAVFGLRPLVAVGRWSYALYLIHWPIYLLLDAEQTQLRPVPLFLLRTVLSVALAALVTTIVERPIRTRRVFVTAQRTIMVSAVAATLLVVAIVALPRPALSENDQLLAAGESEQIIFANESNGSVDSTTATTAPPIPVLLVGSDPVAADLLRSRGLTVIDGTNRFCPIVQAFETQLPTGEVAGIAGCTDATSSWVAMARANRVLDVVISFGPIDEGVTRTVDEVEFTTNLDFAELGRRWSRVFDKLGFVWDSFPSDFDLHLLHQSSERFLVEALTRFAVGRSLLSSLHSSTESLADTLLAARTDDSKIHRVLVVGDSTSVSFAVALFRASAGRLEVRWVGGNGCPYVDVEAVRTSADDPWDFLSHCRSKLEQVSEQLATYTPHVVVGMVSSAELRYQRYKGDDRDHLVGDATYTQVHDDFMEAFIAPLAERGATLLVADSPWLRANELTYSTDEMVSPERIALWNAQIQRWVDSSPDIELLPYAAAINEYESTIGEVLVDGLHPDIDILTEIMREQLLDVILAAASRN